MHLSSSVHILQAKVTTHQQKFVPTLITTRIQCVMLTSPTTSRLRKRTLFLGRSLDRLGLKVATRLVKYDPTNVGLLCCVGSGSNEAIPERVVWRIRQYPDWTTWYQGTFNSSILQKLSVQ